MTEASYKLTWEAADPDGDEFTIDLFYGPNSRSDGSKSIQYQLPSERSEWLWDTNSIPDGRYYIRAVVKDSRGAVTDVYSEGAVIISQPTPYDLNRDGVVNIIDLVLVANRFGETIVGQPDANPDLNGDGVVDILDLVLIAAHFGESIQE